MLRGEQAGPCPALTNTTHFRLKDVLNRKLLGQTHPYNIYAAFHRVSSVVLVGLSSMWGLARSRWVLVTVDLHGHPLSKQSQVLRGIQMCARVRYSLQRST